ncbi:MAG: FBP domain-containing protein [Rhodococcus sp. (in: high G+C Gram-positive bacteria)]
MITLTDAVIRSSLVNASRKEKSDLTLPVGFDSIDFQSLDYLGWRDPKMGRRAYAIVPSQDGEMTGVLLVQAQATPHSRAQCSWCHDTRLPNDVVFYGAKLAGAAGRRGSTVGTLICRDFQCSANVRNDPPLPYPGYDRAAARRHRIDELHARATSFVERVIRE